MKRHLRLMIWGLLPACSLLMAQDYYGPTGDGDRETREFNFNPGNMMNRMPNPMQNFFGSSNRRYDGYPEGRYAPPPAYPPAYGYPTHQPPAGYGYGYPYPQTAPVQAAPTPAAPTPTPTQKPQAVRSEPKPSAPEYRLPGNMQGYRFRPMDNQADTKKEDIKTAAPVPQQEALAPIEPSSIGRMQEPLAPFTYPEATETKPPPAKLLPETVTHEGRTMKFRPLDQPGYTPDLDP